MALSPIQTLSVVDASNNTILNLTGAGNPNALGGQLAMGYRQGESVIIPMDAFSVTAMGTVAVPLPPAAWPGMLVLGMVLWNSRAQTRRKFRA